MKKWWVKLLLALLVLVLVPSILLFHSGSDSKKLVEQYRNQLLAAGEKLDPENLIPPRADVEKNGAALLEEAARSFAPYGANMISTNPPIAMNIVAPGKASVVWQQGEIVSLVSRRLMTNGWAEVERDLANQDYALSTLQQAAERPQFDFGLEYRQVPLPLPHLSKLRRAAELLSTAAIFDLHRGDAASAATNLQTLVAIANAGKDEPLIVSQMYRTILLQKALAVQWEWLQATNLTEEQLARFQARWTNMDFVGPMEKAMMLSRSMARDWVDQMRAGKSPYASSGPGVPGSVFWGGSIRAFIESSRQRAGDALWRESWSYEDELDMLQTYTVMIEMARQARTNGFFKDAVAEREREITALGLNRTNANWLRAQVRTQYPEYGAGQTRGIANSMDRMIATEAWRQCAIAAIALKRYELRHGTLPKDLNALAPEFLPEVPRDPVDGNSLRYHLNADGTFVLYSIGVDGIDDGGDGSPVPPTKALQWQATRDLVWPQPATPQEVQFYYDHPPK